MLLGQMVLWVLWSPHEAIPSGLLFKVPGGGQKCECNPTVSQTNHWDSSWASRSWHLVGREKLQLSLPRRSNGVEVNSIHVRASIEFGFDWTIDTDTVVDRFFSYVPNLASTHYPIYTYIYIYIFLCIYIYIELLVIIVVGCCWRLAPPPFRNDSCSLRHVWQRMHTQESTYLVIIIM